MKNVCLLLNFPLSIIIMISLFSWREGRAWESWSAWQCRGSQPGQYCRGPKPKISSTQLMFLGIIAMLGYLPVERMISEHWLLTALLRRISECMPGMLTVGTARIFMEKRPACISSRTSQRRRCQVYVHRKLYYCGLFSYSKPILSAEHEQTIVVSAQSCAEMARTKSFVRCMTESVIVPGKSYIMELKVSFQTASNSKVKGQGQDILLNGSIQKGIVQHAEYVVQIESKTVGCNSTISTTVIHTNNIFCTPCRVLFATHGSVNDFPIFHTR